MSTFVEKYLNAPAIRDIRLDELKPGMVIRGTFAADDNMQVTTLRVHSVKGCVVHSKSGSWAVGLSERLELLEDVASTREVLATELARSVGLIWGGMPEVHREFYYNLADTAIKWVREPERTWEKTQAPVTANAGSLR